MIKLNFSEDQFESLKAYFRDELRQTEQKISDVQGILSKLGPRPPKAALSAPKVTGRKRGRPAKAKPVIAEKPLVKERKKPGPKPKISFGTAPVNTSDPVQLARNEWMERPGYKKPRQKSVPKQAPVINEDFLRSLLNSKGKH